MDRKRLWLIVPFFAITSLLLLVGCNLDPNHRKLNFLAQGDRAFQQDKYAEAVIDYGRALQIDPQFAEAHYKLAQSYLKEQVWAGAYQELMRTVTLQPDNWPAQLDLGIFLLRAEKGHDAKDRALLILQNNPNNPDAQALLSSADAFLGNRKEALEEAQQAVKMAPNRANVFLNLGLIQARYGAFEDAERSLLQVKALDPNSDGPLM